MGGTLSMLLGSRYPVKGVITIAAPIQFSFWWEILIPVVRYFIPDWEKNWNGFEKQVSWQKSYDRYPLHSIHELIKLCKVTKSELDQLNCSVLILHAMNDKRVPVKNAKIIYDGIANTKKKLITYPADEHVLIYGSNAPAVNDDILNFVCENM